jgi:hypothetical protein
VLFRASPVAVNSIDDKIVKRIAECCALAENALGEFTSESAD